MRALQGLARPDVRTSGRPVCAVHRRRQGVAPCLPDSQPGGSLLAVRRRRAGRTRTSIARGRSSVSLAARGTPSTGIEPASPGRQPGRVSRRVRRRAVKQYPERGSARPCARPELASASSGRPQEMGASGVRDRCPRPLDDRGVGVLDLRRVAKHARPEGIVLERRPGRPRALGGARRAEPGSARREHAGRWSRLRRLGSNQRLPGNNRSSCR